MMDRASQIRTYKSSTAIPLPAGTSVPGYATWQPMGNIINFDTAWKSGKVELGYVVFYNFADNTIYDAKAITGNLTVMSKPIPPKAVIRLYFNYPIDFRSISPSYDRNLADCQTNVNNCRIRVMQKTNAAGVGGTAYSGNTIIPLLPDSSQVILLPPLEGQIQGGGIQHAIVVNAPNMTTWNGQPGTNTGTNPLGYTITFLTQ